MGMTRYRIMHRPTQQWWEGEAESAHEACVKAGWMIGDCYVREQKSRGGWGTPQVVVRVDSRGQGVLL
jgi:hypothetical protein